MLFVEYLILFTVEVTYFARKINVGCQTVLKSI